MQSTQLRQRSRTAGDIAAGLSIAGLLLPEAVAYSGIANLPPQAGVVALFAGLLGYALVGRSRFAIVSATSSSAAVVAATSNSMAAGDAPLRLALAAAFVLTAGMVFTIAALARLGNATDFIAKPVLRGFTFGLAIFIIVKQLPVVLGLHASQPDLLHLVLDLARRWREWNPYDLAIGAAGLTLLFVLGRFRRLPGPLIVLSLGILANVTLDLQQHGIAVVGQIRLDTVHPTIPMLSRADWLRLAEVSVALVLVLYSESAGSIRNFALKHGDTVSPNRDLYALGLANLLSGLFQGMPVGAGYSATAANEAAGAHSRLASVVAAGTVLLFIVLALSWLALTPAAILAAIVIHALSHTINPGVFRPYFVWKRDRLVVLLAVVAVLVLGVLDGLLVAVAISIAMLLRGFAQADVAELRRHQNSHDFVDSVRNPDALPVPGVLVLRPTTPVFFANVDRTFAHVFDRVIAALPRANTDALTRAPASAGTQASGTAPERPTALPNRTAPRDDRQAAPGSAALMVVVSLEETPDLDGTTIEALAKLGDDIERAGGRLLLARLKPPILDALARASIAQLPAGRVSFFSVDDAVTAAMAELAHH